MIEKMFNTVETTPSSEAKLKLVKGKTGSDEVMYRIYRRAKEGTFKGKMKIFMFRVSESYREPHRSPSLLLGQMLLGIRNPLGRQVGLHTWRHCHLHTVQIGECSPVYATRVDAESMFQTISALAVTIQFC
jgi:hypothetical protein